MCLISAMIYASDLDAGKRNDDETEADKTAWHDESPQTHTNTSLLHRLLDVTLQFTQRMTSIHVCVCAQGGEGVKSLTSDSPPSAWGLILPFHPAYWTFRGRGGTEVATDA